MQCSSASISFRGFLDVLSLVFSPDCRISSFLPTLPSSSSHLRPSPRQPQRMNATLHSIFSVDGKTFLAGSMDLLSLSVLPFLDFD